MRARALDPSDAPSAALAIAEALLFAASGPLSAEEIAARLPTGVDVDALLERLADDYRTRGVNLLRVNGRWCFRTAPRIGPAVAPEPAPARRLSRAALEILAICAWHQPVSRAEIEYLRGISVSSGTLDQLLELGFVQMRGRRRTPGRPVTYGTTDAFLLHFGLESLDDLPGLDELEAAGLVRDGRATRPSPFSGSERVVDGDALGADPYEAMVEARRAAEPLDL